MMRMNLREFTEAVNRETKEMNREEQGRTVALGSQPCA